MFEGDLCKQLTNQLKTVNMTSLEKNNDTKKVSTIFCYVDVILIVLLTNFLIYIMYFTD